MPFFGQSFGDFKGRLGGLLDPESGQLQGLTANPVFGLGMGLLSANQDPTQNLAQGALAGLTSAKKQAQSDEDRQRMQQLREQLQALIAQQAGGDPNTATEQALQMSLVPGMAGSGMATGPGAQMGGNPLAALLGQQQPQAAQADAALMEQARAMLAQRGETRPTDKDVEMMMQILRTQATGQ